MVAFIDIHRDVDGVEPICAQLPIAPSTYYAQKAQARDPAKRSARAPEPVNDSETVGFGI